MIFTADDLALLRKAQRTYYRDPDIRVALVLRRSATGTVLEVHETRTMPAGFDPPTVERRHMISLDTRVDNWRGAPVDTVAVEQCYRSEPGLLAGLCGVVRPGDIVQAYWKFGNATAYLDDAGMTHDTVTIRVWRKGKFVCEMPFDDVITPTKAFLIGFNARPYM